MVCPSCAHANRQGEDFCARCGGYLRWELSGVVGTVDAMPPSSNGASAEPAQSTASRVSEAAERERVELTLRPVGDPEPVEGRVAVRVAPGTAGTLVAEIDNRTSVVDHFHVRVSGLPADWCTVTPPTVHLNPYGARGEHRAAAQIRLCPPRSPGAEARAWPFTVELLSEDRQSQVAVASATLVIQPYEDLAVEARPERRAGRRRARFDVLLRNRGNAPVEVDVAVVDEEEACRIAVAPGRITAPPGEQRRARVTAHAPKPIWFGRAVDRNLQMTARPGESDAPPAPVRVVFRQRPWLPWWLPLAAVLLAALLLLALQLLPRTTEVPDLRGAKSPFAAQQRLTEAGLRLAPNPQRRVTRKAPPGRIVAQDPAPGDEVDKGSVVTVVQAVGSRMRAVPSVVGLSPQDADRTLRELGLVLGTVQPQPAELDAKIALQLPDAGVRVKQGTAVNVSLEPGAKPGKSVPEPKSEQAGPGPGGGGAGGAPDSSGSFGRGSSLAFDDGQNLSLWDPAAGRVIPLTRTGTAARPVVEPAWSADGQQLAYMHVDASGRGRIFVLDVQSGESSARPVDGGQGDHHRPSISPSGELLAFISEDSTSGGRVCLQPNDGRPHVPSCLRPGSWKFRGRPAWSPDGRSMLVIASARGNPALSGLFRYVTQIPGSPRARDWRPAGPDLVLPLAHPNSIAWSPDGGQVAVMASPDGARYHLFLIPAQAGGLTGTQRPLSDVTGCEASWRPDGKLAISVYDCSQPVAAAGQILLLDPARPASFTRLSGVDGRNPAWQPSPLP